MPYTKAKSNSSGGRRDRLTLAKLASYDDVATDALVDRVRISTPLPALNTISVPNFLTLRYYRPISGPTRARTEPNTFLCGAYTMTMSANFSFTM